jgi:hypothetical protein
LLLSAAQAFAFTLAYSVISTISNNSWILSFLMGKMNLIKLPHIFLYSCVRH